MRLLRLSACVLLASAFAVAVPAASFAQTAQPTNAEKKAAKSEGSTETKANDKTDDKAKAPKKLTPQQQKMKTCGAKWQEEKKAKGVSGKAAYQTFLKGCLKG
jgi:hypothetical protein